MEVKLEINEVEGLFFIEENNQKVGKLYFRLQGKDRMVIEHTEVSPAMEGKGLGKQLVDKAVEYARQHQFKIIPLCKFAKSVFQRFKGYEDVL